LRRQQTDAESLLWQRLRGHQLAGHKFRRQVPVPPYVLDFYCHQARLAVELDGGQHFGPAGAARDRKRTAALAAQGIEVLRFSDRDVLREPESVLEAILEACRLRTKG